MRAPADPVRAPSPANAALYLVALARHRITLDRLRSPQTQGVASFSSPRTADQTLHHGVAAAGRAAEAASTVSEGLAQWPR